MHLKQWLFSSLFLLGLVLVGLPALLTPPILQASPPPASVAACIPQQQVARTEPIGSTQYNGSTYYLLAAYEAGDSVSSDLVISTQGNQCAIDFYNPMGDAIALSSELPQPVARQLTLARYRIQLQQLGQAEFQRQINEAAQGNPTWFDEEVWALQQLGLEVPGSVQIQN